MKRAFLFPGQGSQVVGMGKDIYENYSESKEIFDKASKITGIDVCSLCFDGPQEKLNQTEYTQIAILTTSLAILEILNKKGITPKIAVGLSLGEYVALVCGKYISLEDAISLIQKRGYFMQHSVAEGEFQMVAVIGLESSKIEEICKQMQEKGKFVVPANYNYSMQTVLSGTKQEVEEIQEILKQNGAKKVIPLKTSGPFHTEKLEKAKQEYQKELEKITFLQGDPNIKVIKNMDGTYYTGQDDFVKILTNHIVSPVRFDKAIKDMEQEGIEQYIEIGPGKALTGFIKKENREANTVCINDKESLEKFLKESEEI